MAAQTHATRFLNLGDTEETAYNLVRGILRSAIRDRVSRRALQKVDQWASGELMRLVVEPSRALSDDRVLELLAAARVVAARLPPQTRRISSRVLSARVADLIDTAEVDFVPSLLKEVRRRIAERSAFASMIAEARSAVPEQGQRAATLRREVIGSIPAEVVDDPELPRALQRASEEGIGILVIVILAAAIAVWYFAEREKLESDDEDEE
jgi:hypothetical protein